MVTELETVAPAVAAGDHDDNLQRFPATAPVPIPGHLDHHHHRPGVPDRAVRGSGAGATPDGASSSASGSSFNYSLSTLPSLAKSNSTASAGAFSLTSHVSIPVTGALPYGSLQVVQSPPDEGSLKTPVAPAAAARPPPPRSTPSCLLNGDVFLILGLPDGFTVGCDTVALTTKAAAASGSEFLGFRDLPPGPHFIWISEPNALSRSGYWFVTKSMGDVRVKQWDSYTEVLGDAASQFEVRNQRNNVEHIYEKLVPYRHTAPTLEPPPPPPKDPPPKRFSAAGVPDVAYDDSVIWHHLTSSISENLLRRVTGKKGPSEWLVDTTDTSRGETDFTQASRLFKAVVGSELTFLFPPDAVDLHIMSSLGQISGGRDISSASSAAAATAIPDTTPDVLAVLSFSAAGVTEADIVGELQFLFLTGMHLSNVSCIDQWWHLVLKILLRAHALVVSRPGLCRAWIQTFHAQMVYSDRFIAGADRDGAGILDTKPQNKANLREALTVFKRRLNEALLGLGDTITKEQGAVGHAFVNLEAWFWKYGWDLRSDYVPEKLISNLVDDEDDEYQPVVIQLDDRGREVGLVSWS